MLPGTLERFFPLGILMCIVCVSFHSKLSDKQLIKYEKIRNEEKKGEGKKDREREKVPIFSGFTIKTLIP